MPADPKITVLMPAYNAGKYIAESIRSVLAQTFTDLELLIVLDGATDDTEAVVRSFADPRIVLVTKPHSGIADSLNVGLKLARAPLIARFDADDCCYPQRLQLQYDFMNNHPDVAIVGSAADYMDLEGDHLFTHRAAALTAAGIRRLDVKVCPFIHSTVMYRKTAVTAIGGYDPHAHTFEDHLLWRRLLSTENGANLPVPLIKVRLNPGSLTTDERWRSPDFRRIKRRALEERRISAADGDRLREATKQQHVTMRKTAAYYTLCAKKFLVNNFRPRQARSYLLTSIRLYPYRVETYLLYPVSYLPERFVKLLHRFRQ